jgi:outer membrane protein assembly factor BamA
LKAFEKMNFFLPILLCCLFLTNLNSAPLQIDSTDLIDEQESQIEENSPRPQDLILEKGLQGVFENTTPVLVKNIKWSGLYKSQESFLQRLITLKEGEIYTEKKLEQDIQKLKNTRLFLEVKANVNLVKNEIDILFEIKEKWTLIPVVRGGSAGGTSFFYLGFYELNFFGQGVTIGAQYENISGKSGGVVWYRSPDFLNTSYLFETDIGKQQKPKFIFKNNFLDSSFFVDKIFIENSFGKKIFKNSTLQTSFLFAEETYSLQSFKSQQIVLPKKRFIFSPKIKLTNGNIVYNEEKISGFLIEPTVQISSKKILSNEDFQKYSLQVSYFKHVNQIESTLAFRNFLGHVTQKNQLRFFSVGGLDGLRGFPDGFVSQETLNFSNLEMRSKIYKSKYFIVQSNIFNDFALGRLKAVSVGAGLRVLVPSVARLNLRLDYGVSIVPKSFSGFVLGMQQYF